MTPNRSKNVRNEFSMPDLVKIDILHLYIQQKSAKFYFTSRSMAAILKTAILNVFQCPDQLPPDLIEFSIP